MSLLTTAVKSKIMESVRDKYAHFQTISTRWKDNDLYGHVNNVEYYSFFDTVINRWLIQNGELDIHKGEVIGVCAESSCKFHSSIAFPDAVEAGLRIAHIGRSSVRYEIGLFSGRLVCACFRIQRLAIADSDTAKIARYYEFYSQTR